MTIKADLAAGNEWLIASNSTAFNLPAADCTIGILLNLDGLQTSSDAQYLLSNAPFAAVGSFQMAYRTTASSTDAGKVVVYSGTASTVKGSSPQAVTSGSHLFFFERTGSLSIIRQVPVRSTPAGDGSSVLSAGAGSAVTPSGQGLAIFNRFDLPNNRLCDQSIGRVFAISGTLTAIEMERLAYGEEITSLGKTLIWPYYRMDTVDDIQPRGPVNVPLTKSGNLSTSSTQPAFGYVPPGVAPAFATQPTVNGTPQAGATLSYTNGSVTGTPDPTITQQWVLNGLDVPGATGLTYAAPADSGGKTVAIRVTAANGSGSATTTSATKTIAAAPVETLTVTLQAKPDWVYARMPTSATVVFQGAYEGQTPASIEYQLWNKSENSVLKAWSGAGATIGSGAFSASIAIPQGGMYKIQFRSKTSAGAVITTSAIAQNLFGVGDRHLFYGSSSAERPFLSSSGTGFTPAENVRFTTNGTTMSQFGTVGSAILYANSLASQAGVPIALINCGQGGSSLANWLVTTGTQWTNLKSVLTALGGQLAGAYLTVGSNDVTDNNVVSRVSHRDRLLELIGNLRSFVNQPTLKINLRGMNRRTSLTAPQAVMANYVRMAEKDVGKTTNVVHTQALHFVLSSDGIHLTDSASGFPADATFNAAIFGRYLYGDGVYTRGPELQTITITGTTGEAKLMHGTGTDFTPTGTITGFAAVDAQGAGVTVTATKASPDRIALTFSATPDKVTYLSGGAPVVGTQVFDNNSPAMPMYAETDLPINTAAEPEPSTGSFLSSQITSSNLLREPGTVCNWSCYSGAVIGSVGGTATMGSTPLNAQSRLAVDNLPLGPFLILMKFPVDGGTTCEEGTVI